MTKADDHREYAALAAESIFDMWVRKGREILERDHMFPSDRVTWNDEVTKRLNGISGRVIPPIEPLPHWVREGLRNLPSIREQCRASHEVVKLNFRIEWDDNGIPSIINNPPWDSKKTKTHPDADDLDSSVDADGNTWRDRPPLFI